MQRRSFLKMLGLSPLAAKAAVESEQMHQAGITQVGQYPTATNLPPGETVDPSIIRALMDAAFRAEWESALYQQNRSVYFLDHDLANKRSFSLAAKIAFQRQRNVERQMAESCGISPWRWMSQLRQRAKGT